MQELPKKYQFSDKEKKWQAFWQNEGIYLWDQNETRDNTFIVDTPPPTVSGMLHIGHVYSYTNADFIVRFWRMMGKNIFYPMGFDDNGLPTERLVEKQKDIRAINMPRQEFINICNEVIKAEETKFRALFNDIALSVDWNLQYQTISPLSRTLSQMSFLDLIQKGVIYRSSQPMLWDSIDRTALAQADIEDKEKSSVMNDIIFTTRTGTQLIIATTRPEMLPACACIFYHPDDERYNNLKGQYATTPLFGINVPILADDMVKPEKGTGIVMCCTFGDTTDVAWWQKHKLHTKIIIDKLGKITDTSFDENCHNIEKANQYFNMIKGLKVKDARSKIIEILKSENLLIKQTEMISTVKCAERSGTPLEILTTDQWFIRSVEHKETMLKRSNELNWYPKSMKIRLDNWINSISWDWCISRQRYFGVPMPVWYSKRKGEEGKPIFANIEQLPVDPLQDLPSGYNREEIEPDLDVMDTWATSAVSPQLNSHAISADFAVDIDRHKQLFPADLRPQAHEILRTWAFTTILKSHLHENVLPWKDIMISGWCLAENKSKMSKSKGNIVDPIALIKKYGSDVVRYWASKSKLGADTAYSEDVMHNGKRLVNKVYNAAKFVSQHFDILSVSDKNASIDKLKTKICSNLDIWFIAKLHILVKQVEDAMREYEYANAMYNIELFFWSVFCDDYLEIAKIRAYNADKKDKEGQYSAVLTLYHAMQIILKLFAPFIPHITEEIYQTIYVPQSSLHTKGNWPQLGQWQMTKSANFAENLITILHLVRKFKAERNLSVKAPIDTIKVTGITQMPEDLILDLKNVTSAKEIEFDKSVSDNIEASFEIIV